MARRVCEGEHPRTLDPGRAKSTEPAAARDWTGEGNLPGDRISPSTLPAGRSRRPPRILTACPPAVRRRPQGSARCITMSEHRLPEKLNNGRTIPSPCFGC